MFTIAAPGMQAANQLIDEGRLLTRAEKHRDPRDLAAVRGWSLQKRALARLVYVAQRDFPALMFRALFEGWSACKIRLEINKKLGRSGKGEGK